MHDVGNTKYLAPKLSFVNILLNLNNLFFTSSILRLAVKNVFTIKIPKTYYYSLQTRL